MVALDLTRIGGRDVGFPARRVATALRGGEYLLQEAAGVLKALLLQNADIRERGAFGRPVDHGRPCRLWGARLQFFQLAAPIPQVGSKAVLADVLQELEHGARTDVRSAGVSRLSLHIDFDHPETHQLGLQDDLRIQEPIARAELHVLQVALREKLRAAVDVDGPQPTEEHLHHAVVDDRNDLPFDAVTPESAPHFGEHAVFPVLQQPVGHDDIFRGHLAVGAEVADDRRRTDLQSAEDSV